MGGIKKYFSKQCKMKMFGLDCEDTSDFYLSCWQTNRATLPLLLLRAILFLGSLAIVLSSVILTANSNYLGYWLIFMTHWGIMINTLATGLSLVVSAMSYFDRPIGGYFGTPWYLKMFWALYNAAITSAFFITIFYWIFLTDLQLDEGDTDVQFAVDPVLDLFIHAINSVVMFVLLMTSRIEARLNHFTHPVLFFIIYLVFTIIYFFAGGTNGFGYRWIYPMLDWESPGPSAVMVVIVAIVVIMLHCVVVGLAAARDAVAKRLRGDNRLDISD